METIETFKKEIAFVDAKHIKFTLDVEITERNKYPEFTISGTGENSHGQVLDNIKPANEHQQKLVDLWKQYHLKNVGNVEDFTEDLEQILSDIEEKEEERRGKPLKDLSDAELIAVIERETYERERDAELCAALVKMFDLCENDLQDIEIDGTRVTVQGTDYIAGDDSEMDEEWDAEMENYLDECVLPELPENARRYFDREAWKRDAEYDGRGHALNRYDGGEESAEVNDTTYFAYQQ